MDRRVVCIVLKLLTFHVIDSVPGDVQHMLICESVKNAIATQHNEVVEIRLQSELRYLRLSYYDTFFASIL